MGSTPMRKLAPCQRALAASFFLPTSTNAHQLAVERIATWTPSSSHWPPSLALVSTRSRSAMPCLFLRGALTNILQLIFCLLVAYPLGSLYIRVPASQPNLRHLFSVTVAVLFFFPVLKIYSAFFHLLASILATYFIAKYDTSKKMPWVVFV